MIKLRLNMQSLSLYEGIFLDFIKKQQEYDKAVMQYWRDINLLKKGAIKKAPFIQTYFIL